MKDHFLEGKKNLKDTIMKMTSANNKAHLLELLTWFAWSQRYWKMKPVCLSINLSNLYPQAVQNNSHLFFSGKILLILLYFIFFSYYLLWILVSYVYCSYSFKVNSSTNFPCLQRCHLVVIWEFRMRELLEKMRIKGRIVSKL